MNTSGRWLGVVATSCMGAMLALAPAAQALATSAAEVEGLQMPAWLTRDGKRVPLAVGAQVRNGDTITTGEGARVLLRLPEGSAVKLGENARFELNDMLQRRNSNRQLFSATLGVTQGAFRFTTPSEDKSQSARKIDVKFPTITASITGTDIWGKSSANQDLVALIEGKMNVTRKGEQPVTITQARTVYIAPPDAPRTLQTITVAQLNGFAQETEMQAGAGVAGRGGNWKIYAASTPNKDEALAIYERVLDAGYSAAIQPTVSGGKQVFNVRIVGLMSEADGVAVAVKLRVQLGLQDVRVSL
jgi:FecR protein/SPOR domain